MIVECISVIDPLTMQSKSHILNVGKKYIVLEIYFNHNGEGKFRINDDSISYTPVIYNSQLFKTVCPKIPSNWVCNYNKGYLRIGPWKWLDDSLWEYSFWESFTSLTCPEAEKVFQEERQIVIQES